MFFFYLFCLSWMPSCQGAFPKSDWFSSRKKPVLTCIFYLFLCVLRWKTCTMKVFLNFTFIQDLESWRQITNASSADSAGFLNRGVQNWRDFPSLWFDFDRLTFWGVQNWPNFPALCYGLNCSKWEKLAFWIWIWVICDMYVDLWQMCTKMFLKFKISCIFGWIWKSVNCKW